VLTDLSTPALVKAVKDNLNELSKHLRNSPATEWREVGGLYTWWTPIPGSSYNGVVCAEPPGANADEGALASIEYFRARNTAAFTWWFAPEIEIGEWAPHLLPHGFVHDQQTPGMACDLAGLAAVDLPPSVEIRPVEDLETLHTWVQTFVPGTGLSEAWEEPQFEVYAGLLGAEDPMRHYLASLDGQPVATASLFLGAGVAGIYDVATLPAARRRGIGTAVTRAPLLEARAMGHRVGILQSSPMGLAVYDRMGFRTVCRMEHFLWKADGSRTPIST
jgi:GNAT superfamily N-acetyltransferase